MCEGQVSQQGMATAATSEHGRAPALRLTLNPDQHGDTVLSARVFYFEMFSFGADDCGDISLLGTIIHLSELLMFVALNRFSDNSAGKPAAERQRRTTAFLFMSKRVR